MFLHSYEEWRHCIEVKCGIPLTQTFVLKRIEELNDLDNKDTQEFIKLYGKPYKNQIVEWFTQSVTTIK
jgi:hypothetical protein